MDKIMIGMLSAATGVAIFYAGYKVGKHKANKEYVEWQENHKFSCWKPKKKASTLGDYPPVFVIETVTSSQEV